MVTGENVPINVGIAGLGRSGWGIHANLLAKLPDYYKVVAVFDQAQPRLEEAAARFGCRTYTDYEEFLKDPSVELVTVATPSYLHSAHVIAALETGHNVLCEKPMARNTREADEMIATARKSGRVFTVFQNRRYDPDFLKVKETIESGKLGKILLIKSMRHYFQRRSDWQTLKEFGGGILNNWGAHLLDQALLLLGPQEPEVLCQLEHTVSAGDAEDYAKVVLKSKGGLVFDVELVGCAAFSQENWFVVGTSGGIQGTTQELKIKWFDPAALPAITADPNAPPDRSYGKSENIPWQSETWRAIDTPSDGGRRIYIELYRTIKEGGPLAITPESVRRQIALIEKCKTLSPV